MALLAVIRGIQAISTLAAANWARRVGMLLAIIDFATPITLPFGFWTLVVYRKPETREYFKRREAAAER